MEEDRNIEGVDIDRVFIRYENICVLIKDDVVFIKPEELRKILQKHKYKSAKARTRYWLIPTE